MATHTISHGLFPTSICNAMQSNAVRVTYTELTEAIHRLAQHLTVLGDGDEAVLVRDEAIATFSRHLLVVVIDGIATTRAAVAPGTEIIPCHTLSAHGATRLTTPTRAGHTQDTHSP